MRLQISLAQGLTFPQANEIDLACRGGFGARSCVIKEEAKLGSALMHTAGNRDSTIVSVRNLNLLDEVGAIESKDSELLCGRIARDHESDVRVHGKCRWPIAAEGVLTDATRIKVKPGVISSVLEVNNLSPAAVLVGIRERELQHHCVRTRESLLRINGESTTTVGR